jgi:hypothetical protein
MGTGVVSGPKAQKAVVCGPKAQKLSPGAVYQNNGLQSNLIDHMGSRQPKKIPMGPKMQKKVRMGRNVPKRWVLLDLSEKRRDMCRLWEKLDKFFFCRLDRHPQMCLTVCEWTRGGLVDAVSSRGAGSGMCGRLGWCGVRWPFQGCYSSGRLRHWTVAAWRKGGLRKRSCTTMRTLRV